MSSMPVISVGRDSATGKLIYQKKWCSVDTGALTYEQRQKYQEDQERIRAAREAEERKNHLEAKEKAQRIWDNADPADSHPYLENKAVASHYLRVSRGALVIPSPGRKQGNMVLAVYSARRNEKVSMEG